MEIQACCTVSYDATGVIEHIAEVDKMEVVTDNLSLEMRKLKPHWYSGKEHQ